MTASPASAAVPIELAPALLAPGRPAAPVEPDEKADAAERTPPRWSQDRRLEFLDFRLRWEGRINRSALTDFFGISVPQASLDIQRYLELAPRNASYDRSSRIYVASPEFAPLYPSNEPGRFLSELLMLSTGVLPAEQSFLGWVPPTATVPVPARQLNPQVVVAVLTAIRARTRLRLVYQSMSTPEPTERLVSPHAVAFDGFRWHARAYCHEREAFRDFVLARMLQVQGVGEPGTDGAPDSAWHETVPLVLAPNARLAKAVRRVIELDYGMQDGEILIECRQAMLFYALKHLDLLDAEARSARAQPLVLRNRAAVMRKLPEPSA